MAHRQRYLDVMAFRNPDRVTFFPGRPTKVGVDIWRTQGLPEGVAWRDHLLEVLGIADAPDPAWVVPPVDFHLLPKMEAKVLRHSDGHVVYQYSDGNVCEFSDEFIEDGKLVDDRDFITRRWVRCPVETREDWEQMKLRYDVGTPGRFADDFVQRCAEKNQGGELLTVCLPGAFWQLRDWCGFEGLCMMLVDDPELVADMAAFWREFIATMLERIVAHFKLDRPRRNEAPGAGRPRRWVHSKLRPRPAQ